MWQTAVLCINNWMQGRRLQGFIPFGYSFLWGARRDGAAEIKIKQLADVDGLILYEHISLCRVEVFIYLFFFLDASEKCCCQVFQLGFYILIQEPFFFFGCLNQTSSYASRAERAALPRDASEGFILPCGNVLWAQLWLYTWEWGVTTFFCIACITTACTEDKAIKAKGIKLLLLPPGPMVGWGRKNLECPPFYSFPGARGEVTSSRKGAEMHHWPGTL